MDQASAEKAPYLPASRASATELARAADAAERSPYALALDDWPDIGLLLNTERQIVWVNGAAIAAFGGAHAEAYLGMRLGEAFGCAHANDGIGGCGTGDFCRFCGTALAIASSIAEGEGMERVTIKLSDEKPLEAIDLLVWTKRLIQEGIVLFLLQARDVSADNRREALERIFYHDILNTASGVKTLLELMEVKEGTDSAGYLDLARSASDQLVGEILSQRALKAAEDESLAVEVSEFDGASVLEGTRDFFRYYLHGRKLSLAMVGRESFPLRSDPVLLKRALANAVKNALEASAPGDEVRISCFREGDRGIYEVWNRAVMGEEARRRVFHRSFTTKGKGRGLGTYGMKLIVERYLGGEVSFSSTEGAGTTFRISLPLGIGP